MTAPVLEIRGSSIPVKSTLVMGVVNASPDSFSDPGVHVSQQERLELAAALIESGAHFVDVGGQSAITNRPELDASVESGRVVPIVEWIRSNYPETLVSVDTYKPIVVSDVLAAGAHMINDVSGLRYPAIAKQCADSGAALVVMHTAAPPKVRLQNPGQYRDVVTDVAKFLEAKIAEAMDFGLRNESIVLDPGPDFAKTPRQTVDLLRNLDGIRALARPVLLAVSRKDFLGAITGRTPRDRDAATAAAIAWLAAAPGNIVRVHDVAAAVDVLATVETLAGAREIPVDYVLPERIRHEPSAG